MSSSKKEKVVIIIDPISKPKAMINNLANDTVELSRKINKELKKIFK